MSLTWRWSKTPRESIDRVVFPSETYVEEQRPTHETLEGESDMLGRDSERIILKLQNSE